MPRFHDRHDAGRQLAAVLGQYGQEDPIVLALPRGGVPVAYEVAKRLGATLDVWVVRKIGLPWHPEVGVGAVAEDGVVHLNHDILESVTLDDETLQAAIETQRREVEARVSKFRAGRAQPSLLGRTVLVVDDGIATGGTVRAAIQSIRAQGPKRIVVAVPVAAAATIRVLETEVDELVCLRKPGDLDAIGVWYDDFTQVPDEQVIRLLDSTRAEPQTAAPVT